MEIQGGAINAQVEPGTGIKYFVDEMYWLIMIWNRRVAMP
jgi:hypothetical protein